MKGVGNMSGKNVSRMSEVGRAFIGFSLICDASLVLAAPRTITVESQVGDVVTLSFPASASASALHVAWGPEDGGEVTNGWRNVCKVADVAAGVTSAQASLPDGFGEKYSHARFFIDEVTSLSDYVSDGLVLHHDGILNAIAEDVPCHSETTSTWTDLCGGTASTINRIYAKPRALGIEYDLRGSVWDALNTRQFGVDDIHTFEVAVRIDAGKDDNDDCVIWAGGNDRAPTVSPVPTVRTGAMKKYGENLILAWGSVNGQLANPYYTNVWGSAVGISYVRKEANVYCAYTDGASTGVSYPFTPSAAIIRLGNAYGYDRGSKGVIYSIRAYSRALTDAEVAQNHEVDERRFIRPHGSSPVFFSGLNAKNLRAVYVDSLTVSHAIPVSARLSFASCPEVTELFAVYSREDGPATRTNGWDRVEKIADVAAGVASLQVELPTVERGAYRKMRFFLTTPVSSYSYVTKGLIAQWDGIDNAIRDGRRVHVSSGKTWADLLGGEAATLGQASWRATGAHSVCGDATTDAAAVTTRPFAANAIGTIDVCATIDHPLTNRVDGQWNVDCCLWAGAVNQGPTVSPVPTARTQNYKDSGDTLKIGWGSVSGVIPSPYYFGLWGDFSTIAYTRASSTYSAYTNGVPTGVTYDFTAQTGSIAFGNTVGYTRGVTGDFHAIRLYSQALTADELAYNRAIDVARFSEGEAWGHSDPIDIPEPGGIILIVR